MQKSTQDIIKQLQAPFPAAAIKWRVGDRSNEGRQGQALPYIDARDVQNRLDEVVGPENWEVTMKPSSVGIISGIRILLNGHWVTKEDGAQFDNFKVNDYNSNSNSKELAIKGAISDAFKRAGVMWGIARYLYAYLAPVVELDQNGQLKSIPKLPEHMLPENERGIEPTGEQQSEASAASETPDNAAAAPVAAAEEAEPTPAPTPPAKPQAEKPSEPEKAGQASNSDGERDERDDRAGALADAAANESSVHGTTRTPAAAPAPAPAPAPVAAQPPAASTGPKVVKGIDYSGLSLNESEEKVVIDLLEKVALALEGKFPAAALKTYVNGGKLKDKLNEPARQWVSKLLSDEKNQAQAA